MSDMSNIEFPANESCPDCKGFIWRDGPRGGMSQNIECAKCGSRFNVTRMSQQMLGHDAPPFIVWAHRLPSEKDGGGVWREDMFPRVCE